ncbi:hypothetical protein CEF21_15605 [Bacillus sp. FJAT-42376]|nr:hypothetical protein CEF21_15605 [Bacillus sp. FJAT-42376]
MTHGVEGARLLLRAAGREAPQAQSAGQAHPPAQGKKSACRLQSGDKFDRAIFLKALAQTASFSIIKLYSVFFENR